MFFILGMETGRWIKFYKIHKKMETKNQIISILDIDDNSPKNKTGLQFSKIEVDEDYRKKWGINQTDFICLTKNGELLRPTLYRIGGINSPKLGVDKYFMLLKHVEAFYSDRILEMCKSGYNGKKPDPKHLESRWCILDEFGNEKAEFSNGNYPYLVDNSCIYSINGKYYNIETGILYCEAFKAIESQDFLFLDNYYDNDESKRGVIKINKKDGTFELFPKK